MAIIFLLNQIDRWRDRGPQVLYVVATRHQVIKGFKNISQIPVGAGLPCPSPIMKFHDQSRYCHAERSEASLCPSSQTLSGAKGDNTFPILVGKVHYRPRCWMMLLNRIIGLLVVRLFCQNPSLARKLSCIGVTIISGENPR